MARLGADIKVDCTALFTCTISPGQKMCWRAVLSSRSDDPSWSSIRRKERTCLMTAVSHTCWWWLGVSMMYRRRGRDYREASVSP